LVEQIGVGVWLLGEGMGDEADGAMFGPGFAGTGLGVLFELAAFGLHAFEPGEGGVCLGLGGVCLGAVFHHPFGGGFREEGGPEAVVGMLGGQDIVGSDFGLDRGGEAEGGEAADEGIVSAGEILWAGVRGRGEDVAELVDEAVVHVGRDAVGEGVRFGSV
jgi:hypothetical protein